MERYTIYCTEAQTRKALELGAPIEYGKYYQINAEILHKGKDGRYELYSIPTAEQVIGWLEEQEDIDDILVAKSITTWYYDVCLTTAKSIRASKFNSRKEATLAAIDAALEYLNKAKEE